MGRILKSYFFWTYERGSFHYDVMVTLILAFIFITPHVWNFGDHPAAGNFAPNEVVVRADGPDGFTYQIPAEQVGGTASTSFQDRLEQRIEHISGPMTIVRYDTLRDASGKVTAYKVWAHR
ncbi:MAG TPA: hypothetical protein VK798_02820 [Alloacidobacterium sp.]|jgi:hypothetical protein|nr:hypothetical protein [Alloacidobacterium sp.]